MVVDVTVKMTDELRELVDRLEQLTRGMTPNSQLPTAAAGIAVVAGAKLSRRQLLGLVWRRR
jgi:hypothetical protein